MLSEAFTAGLRSPRPQRWVLGAGRGAEREVGRRAERNKRPRSLVDRGPASPNSLELEGGSSHGQYQDVPQPSSVSMCLHIRVPEALPEHHTREAGSGETRTVLISKLKGHAQRPLRTVATCCLQHGLYLASPSSPTDEPFCPGIQNKNSLCTY